MNKISLYGLSAVLALGFAACDGYEEPNPAAQTNPQSPVLETRNVSFAYTLPAETVDLEALSANGEMLTIATIKADSVAEGYTFTAKIQASADYLSKHATFDVPVETVLTSEEGEMPMVYDVKVDPNELSGLYQKNVSYNPAAHTIDLSATVYGEFYKGSTLAESFTVGNPTDVKVAALSIKPIEFLQLEEEYYLIPSGDFSKAVKFNHVINDPDNDVYANPVFQLIADCSGDFKWQVVPASVYAAGSISSANYAVWGPETKDQLEGALVPQKDGVKPAQGQFTGEGSYQITVNFIDGTYSFVPAISTLWLPGNQQGWSPATATTIITDDYVHFWGFAYLDGEFKFCGQPDWNPYNWGAGAEAGTLTAGGGNLKAEEKGLYYVQANLSELTYGISLIRTWGVIGDATPGGWGSDTALTPNEDFTIWTGQVELGSGSFKFRANNDWGINLGGDMNNLSTGGDNIPAPGEKKVYTITLDLTQYPYFCTVE